MVDLTNPSPLVMTHYELVASVCAFVAVLTAVIYDAVRHAQSRSAIARSPPTENQPP